MLPNQQNQQRSELPKIRNLNFTEKNCTENLQIQSSNNRKVLKMFSNCQNIIAVLPDL